MSPSDRVLEVVLIVDTSVPRARLARVMQFVRDWPRLTSVLHWPLVGRPLVRLIFWWARRGITFTHERPVASPASGAVDSLDGHPKP